MAVEPGGARRGHLRASVRPDLDIQMQIIARQHAAGHVVQMNQGGAVFLRECANHPPGRLLRATTHPGPAAASFEAKFQAGVQLMNRRVSMLACRIEPSSGKRTEASAIQPF